ncbi:MAG TPA: GNAT family N-acetyltransferase [Tepidisphaeraceae bacterium]|jgi:RimJ/RimL family protein N-acetyltransferase
MEIRPAKPEDVPQVLPMVDKLAALHESWDPAKFPYLPNVGQMYNSWMRNRARDKRSVFFVAAKEDGVVVGFIIGTVEREIPIYRIEEFGFIHDLWIEPDYRNEGLARQLVMASVERFRELGTTQVRCDTATANEAARHLFGRCGFRASVTEMMLEMERPAQ